MTIGNKQITKQFVLKLAGFVAIGLVVLGVVVYFGLIWREKRQFIQAEKEIDALYAQIVEKVGKPDQEKKEKSCGYASRVYGKGPRYCNIRRNLMYENRTAELSNQIVNNVFEVSGGTYLQSFGDKTVSKFHKEAEYRTDQELSQDFDDIAGLTCNLKYRFPVVERSAQVFSTTAPENLLISIHCGGPARAEHFLVED